MPTGPATLTGTGRAERRWSRGVKCPPMTGRDQLEGSEKKRALPVQSKTIAAVVIGALIVAFGLANRKTVSVDFLLFSSDVSLIVVIAISGVLGLLLGLMASRRRARPRQKP